MIARLAEFLLDRSARERWLLGLLVALALPAAAIFALLAPLAEAAQRAGAAADEARALRDWVGARAAEAGPPADAPAATAAAPEEPIGISLLDRSLREAGLREAVAQLANRGEGEVELGFDIVRFTELAAWLDRMAPGWGYDIATLRLDRGAAGDMVAARLVLRPGARAGPMIRALALVLGLALGLAAALLATGRMAHLRMAGVVPLPAWTAGLDDRSGVLSGSWRAPAGAVPAAGLDWRFQALDLRGPSFRVAAATPGGALAGRARVDLPARRVALTLADEEIDLAALVAGAGAAGLRGLLSVERLQATLALPGLRPAGLSGRGRIAGLALHGADLGTAPVVLDSRGGTGWQAEVTLDGPLAGTLTLAGILDAPSFRVEGTLRETAPLPSDLRAFLDSVGTASDGGWTVAAGGDARDLLARR